MLRRLVNVILTFIGILSVTMSDVAVAQERKRPPDRAALSQGTVGEELEPRPSCQRVVAITGKQFGAGATLILVKLGADAAGREAAGQPQTSPEP